MVDFFPVVWCLQSSTLHVVQLDFIVFPAQLQLPIIKKYDGELYNRGIYEAVTRRFLRRTIIRE